MLKTVDKITGSALSCAQVASKPRVNERDRTELRYFCADSMKGLSGGRVIQYLIRGNIRAVLVDGFEPPGTFESAIFEKTTRCNMQHPTDLLYNCAHKLAFISDVFNQ